MSKANTLFCIQMFENSGWGTRFNNNVDEFAGNAFVRGFKNAKGRCAALMDIDPRSVSCTKRRRHGKTIYHVEGRVGSVRCVMFAICESGDLVK